MNIINMSKLTKSYTGEVIFENIKYDLNEGDCVGLVGRNGEGKSTLLKLMAGIESPTEGQISWQKNISIGYLNQLPTYEDDKQVYECLSEVFEEINHISKQMQSIETDMANQTDQMEQLLKKYGHLQEQFEERGGYERDAQIRRVSHGLKINHLLSHTWGKLSGGERTKVGLAQILLQQPKLLLLDEPTNHLDISSIDWLADFIKQYSGAVVIVSHDRYFLDDTVNQIAEIDQGQLHIYHGNYSYFVKEKEARIIREYEAYQTQQKKIKKMEDSIKQLRLWASQAKPPNAAMYKRAKSMEKALVRIKRLDKPILEHKKMNVNLAEGQRVSNDVIELEHVSKMYEDILFEEIDLLIRRKEHVAIIGDNGTGKSTLLKMMMNQIEPDEGIVKRASNLRIGYLSQHTFEDIEDQSVIATFREAVHVTEGQARHILAQFMFYGEDVFNKISSLSGGEKMRLRWAQIVNQDFNVLVLDEPTNHLDIDAKETIEDALIDYNGTIIAVSHDRYFLNKLFDTTYLLKDKKLTKYEGNYDYVIEKTKENKTDA
ncbi:ribosomal protection-like ABC-F family protein [Mammaliicoccus vitulinus]|uniref:ribosomal protection-like ABC-F family protein n=1 Tax=Mammaliicoccus vitulinus TaxID=71237 RepID=UPI000D1D454E|nr:ABC-F family ATP-binding cassette domain-containing protein [Mammaliicoccus vitulinus]PTI90693.1 ABC transporter ATP-binding protein [Mammaliicoccus vitulinus]QQT14877.1 ABC-F family ATP-binding cassette domain-containing protein [Mammaliicoccus vitulinus]QQY19830.1 ABC-F family ATP-binding cassette domain-containing protein [Mammaliicoccus vitulinus]RTX90231.1 ABC-F family ATP-binding cassette domain-containing protein [Mammaliicoccus vitulinus]GGI02913.1 ABC transporter ATP-binding protei